jgi:hypothetical protein
MLLMSAAPTTGFSVGKSGATITLVSLESNSIAPNGSRPIIGRFLMQNRSQRNICVMRDISENEFSPFLEIVRIGKHDAINNEKGLPFPPRTMGIMTIVPGESIHIDRVLGYNESLRDKIASSIKVRTTAAWCTNGKRFKIESKRITLPASE